MRSSDFLGNRMMSFFSFLKVLLSNSNSFYIERMHARMQLFTFWKVPYCVSQEVFPFAFPFLSSSFSTLPVLPFSLFFFFSLVGSLSHSISVFGWDSIPKLFSVDRVFWQYLFQVTSLKMTRHQKRKIDEIHVEVCCYFILDDMLYYVG